MKLFLCGGGAGSQTIEANRRFNEVIDHTKPLLYIPLAMEPELYPGCLEWIKGEMASVDVPGIEMVTSCEELAVKNLEDYCALFIGGGNTYKLLDDLKVSGAFEKIKDYIEHDGVVFGGSAGAIIFGADLEACALDDVNEVGLEDIAGFDVLNGISLLCHYTNRTKEKDEASREYLAELTRKKGGVLALPEEDTIFVNDGEVEVIGTRPYYYFEAAGVLKLMLEQGLPAILFQGYQWKRIHYNLFISRWGIPIILKAGYRVCDNIECEENLIEITERIYFYKEQLPYPISCTLIEQEINWICRGLRIVREQLEQQVPMKHYIIMAIKYIHYSPCDIQDEAFAAAMMQWCSEMFGFPVPEYKVYFDKDRGRYDNGEYVFEFPT